MRLFQALRPLTRRPTISEKTSPPGFCHVRSLPALGPIMLTQTWHQLYHTSALAWAKHKKISDENPHYDRMFKESIEAPHEFWGQYASDLHWFKQWDHVLHQEDEESSTWFKGGMTNVCYNALDRHIQEGREDQVALIYDSPVISTKKKYTYMELLDAVSQFAGALTSLGVVKGDTVVIYMPMVPEAVIAMLACARIGATHSVVFGGFASDQLAQRIDHAHPKVVISASCGFSGTKVIPYKPLLDAAIDLTEHKPKHCIIFNRDPLRCELTPGRDHDWNALVSKAKPVDYAPLESHHPSYVLYTPGAIGTTSSLLSIGYS